MTKVFIVSQHHGRFSCAIISYALLMFVVCCSLLIMRSLLMFAKMLFTAQYVLLMFYYSVAHCPWCVTHIFPYFAHISLSVARGCYMLFTAPDYVLLRFDIILLATQGLLMFSVLLMVEYMLFNFNASFTCTLLVIHAIMALTFKQ